MKIIRIKSKIFYILGIKSFFFTKTKTNKNHTTWTKKLFKSINIYENTISISLYKLYYSIRFIITNIYFKISIYSFNLRFVFCINFKCYIIGASYLIILKFARFLCFHHIVYSCHIYVVFVLYRSTLSRYKSYQEMVMNRRW